MIKSLCLYVVISMSLIVQPAAAAEPASLESVASGLCASEYSTDSIAWAAECLVKAIRVGDRAALLTLTADRTFLPCIDMPCQYDFVWGEAPWPGAARKTLAGVLANAETVEFLFYGDGGEARAVAFYPGWDWEAANGAEPLVSNENWLVDYFLCDYTFSEPVGIWQIGPGFCYADTGGPFFEEDHAHQRRKDSRLVFTRVVMARKSGPSR